MRRSSEHGAGDSAAVADTDRATAPGKATLTGAIQRRSAPRRDEPGAEPTSGAGSPLPGGVQTKMEDAFDFSFGQVRVHEGPQASALGAVAYTQGTDVHFAPG